MPEIAAFRGIRYDLGHVGSLGDVVAPPYDVIDPEERDRLYKRHAANVVRLILNRPEPGDDQASNPYSRAARFLKNWQAEGLLFTEADPAIYVYHQQFDVGGAVLTRRGFMCRVRLERFGQGNIYPHEETMPGPKADRLKLLEACRANLSPVFGLYPDAQAEAQHRLENAVAGQTPLEATDDLGVVHRMWPITDVDVIAAVSSMMSPKPVYIADGHHRYETACNYRDELAGGGALDRAHPANFVLMMCVGMNDPGMVVLPTHRLFRGLAELTADDLVAKLGAAFSTRIAGEGSDLAESIWNEIELADDQRTLSFYTAKDDRWMVATLSEEGQAQMDKVAADHGQTWRGLGVSILHRLVIENLLGAGDLPKPKYVHQVSEVVSGLESGDFPLAALVMPATLDHIREISEQAERMPAKSTYFYPKLLSGLVINPLE